MKIITCKYIYKDRGFLEDYGIVFNEKIIKIAPLDELKKEFLELEIINYGQNSVLYPGFINPHVHLEFSANRATLNYGSYIEWLNSVIEYREELIQRANNRVIEDSALSMLKSGVTTFGEISSFGIELNVCKNLKQRVIFFNEIIGSNPGIVDAMFSDFKNRLQASINAKSNTLIPAVAIHSPYSVHPILIREVLKIAKEKNLLTTAHFLESKAEREWLEEAKGDFLQFFKNFSNTTKPINTIENFLNAFNDHPTLFTHAVHAKPQEIEYINKYKHSIIHCPRSNRLLNCGKLDISNIDNLTLGTDGLSSNYSLSILDELKAALTMHTEYNPKELALKLIEAVTINPSKALKLNIGRIKEGFFADFAILKIPKDLKNEEEANIALHSIIHNDKAYAVYINGEKLI